MSTRQYKNLKGLKKENLRDNMTALELVPNMPAGATATEISQQRASETFAENMRVAREGGEAAGEARKALESGTGVPVITSQNVGLSELFCLFRFAGRCLAHENIKSLLLRDGAAGSALVTLQGFVQ